MVDIIFILKRNKQNFGNLNQSSHLILGSMRIESPETSALNPTISPLTATTISTQKMALAYTLLIHCVMRYEWFKYWYNHASHLSPTHPLSTNFFFNGYSFLLEKTKILVRTYKALLNLGGSPTSVSFYFLLIRWALF